MPCWSCCRWGWIAKRRWSSAVFMAGLDLPGSESRYLRLWHFLPRPRLSCEPQPTRCLRHTQLLFSDLRLSISLPSSLLSSCNFSQLFYLLYRGAAATRYTSLADLPGVSQDRKDGDRKKDLTTSRRRRRRTIAGGKDYTPLRSQRQRSPNRPRAQRIDREESAKEVDDLATMLVILYFIYLYGNTVISIEYLDRRAVSNSFAVTVVSQSFMHILPGIFNGKSSCNGVTKRR